MVEQAERQKRMEAEEEAEQEAIEAYARHKREREEAEARKKEEAEAEKLRIFQAQMSKAAERNKEAEQMEYWGFVTTLYFVSTCQR